MSNSPSGACARNVFWLRSDFFCRHLLGKSAESVDIMELNREKEQSGDKKKRGTNSPR